MYIYIIVKNFIEYVFNIQKFHRLFSIMVPCNYVIEIIHSVIIAIRLFAAADRSLV